MAYSQTKLTPVSLTLTLYSNGVTQVNYFLKSDPTKVRVETGLFGEDIESVVVRNEDGDPLQINSFNETYQIDSIGSVELHISYQTKDLTSVEDSVWIVNITSPINVTIILPENADFLDMNPIPSEIGSFGKAYYLNFPPGNSYTYYILGLPEVEDEANITLTQASSYISNKQSEGYILTGANELLNDSISYFESKNYIQAKRAADDAILISTDLVEYADQALNSIKSAEAVINEAVTEGRTVGIDEAETTLDKAKTQFSNGYYRNAKITALEAVECAYDAEKKTINYYLIIAGFVFFSLFLLLKQGVIRF